MEKKQVDAKFFFEDLYKTYNKKEYIKTDPIRFPHEITGNTEFIAFTAACFAYGNMKAIQSFLFRYFDYAGSDPFNINLTPNDKLYYRFQTSADIVSYSTVMKNIYNKYGSIGNLFNSAGANTINMADKGIKLLRSHMNDISNGLNFLIPVPGKSASKRLHMFLRWMVRKDDVDFGLWEHFDKTTLYMPSDTHILRMATNMGIIDKNTSGRKALDKITEFFKNLNPNDPAKYDFSITRLGIVNGCKYSKNDSCFSCIHQNSCLFY